MTEAHDKADTMAQLEISQRANEAKSAFLSSMSHDIRTPMNGIIGMTAIAGAHLDDRERVKDCLDKISGASRHLLSLINEILDLSKIESGNITLSAESFSISKVLDEMVNILSPQIRSKNQQFSFHVERVTHEKVIGDPLKLQQVFTNILSNAIKYTPEGGSISVDFTEKPTGSDIIAEYEFVCQDTGYGMSEEYLKKLFQPFESAADERIRNIQGTGLGMVITRSIVRMMDGDIAVESKLDEGSKFTVTFRMKPQDNDDSFDEKLAGLKVLVVDDDIAVCESCCIALKELGMTGEHELLDKLLEKGGYEQAIESYINSYIVEEDRQRMRGATMLAVLWEQVPEVGLYKLGYRREINGVVSYYEMNVAKTIGNNGAVTFIMGLRDVNDEMQRQLKQAREIEAQSEIIEGLGAEYYSVLLVDLDNDGVTPYREVGEDGRDIADYFRRCDFRWTKGVEGYAEKLVSEKSRDELREKLSLDRLRKGGENYSFTYEKLTAHGIEDNGIGMSKEYLEHIFEPFSRAADERVNRIIGTGLGMPISRNIVRMMGGDIKVESTPGVGTRFTVIIFLRLRESVEIDSGKFADLRVLVADDDPLSLDSCCTMLNDFGMLATGVSSGAQAVEQVVRYHKENRDFFACIIDWKMPEMDGIETVRAIRREVGNEVPIIIISAYDWSDIEQEARTAGANAFISKPMFRSKVAKTFNSLVCSDEPQEREASLNSVLQSMKLAGRRVLVVEDNDLNAEIAAEILGMTGLTVERACDGTEAVDMLARCDDRYYDIIFMDIQMPRMNGYDTTRAIRAMKRSYCKQVPIIAMTANAFAEDIQAAKTVGMNEHIAKPLDIKQICRVLNKWIIK